MHVKPGNYYIDMPKSGFFKNANVTDGNLHTACGIYTLAAHCKGALHAFVMHGQFWGSSLWDPNCGFGDPTKFRGVPIIDASKIITPLTTKNFYLSNPVIHGGEEGNNNNKKKAFVTVDLGIKMDISPSGGGDDELMMDDNDDDEKEKKSVVTKYPVFANVTILPRKIASSSSSSSAAAAVSPYSISSDLRISPHGNIPVDQAYILEVFVRAGDDDDNDNNKKKTTPTTLLLNLDYNGSRDVGYGSASSSSSSSSSGRKHTWSSAIPSAIDEDDDDDTNSNNKKFKAAMNSVA
jgi:hypothetical protein